ncbi:MAG: MBL fold metallo-hydrolase [Proteobacteria bacterium]|nr:MBL fold metallo-hydrolase [Pseudomonadota bacterium]
MAHQILQIDAFMSEAISYPFDESPAYGTTREVTDGVHWLRMPLPMSLNHINLYLIEDDHSWTVIDTGIRGEETRNLWHDIFDHCLKGKPVDRVICTHMHPDHTGQAGFISERWRAPLYMSYSEYYQARVMSTMMRDGGNWQMNEYFHRAGISTEVLEQMAETRSNFAPEPEDIPLPASYIRLRDGEELTIGGRSWIVITGSGHSPEHVCLFSPDLKVLLSGDQILPVITSNVSVQPTEPQANPMQDWLSSHEKFRSLLPEDTLVLPAHNEPFYGAHDRLQQLIDHHEDRMLILEEACVEPMAAIDMLPLLFNRELAGHSLFMGLGECVAHLHCLMSRGRIERSLKDGRYQYHSIDPTLPARARPGQHEAKDDEPILT